MSDDRERKLRDSLELDRWKMAKRCAATLEREDWGSESFEVAAFALWYAMSGGQRESLTQILFSGPVWDGDHISKSARDDLFKLGLATRVCHKGEQGFTAASYRAFTVFKASGQEKQRKLDKLRDDRKEREYDALKEFVADKTSASAIAALEAPAQPLDELRSVPGAEEEVRHQFDDGEAMRMAHSIMPGSGATFKTDEEIRASVRSLVPEGFTPHDGGDWKGNPRDAVQVVFESGAVSDVSHTVEDEARFWHWPWDGKSDRIVSFKIIAPAPIPEEDDDWTPTRPGAEITVADLDKLSAKATEEERAGLEIPEGFTKWDGKSACRFHSDTIVECWMGHDDFMGPLRAGDVDWDHHSDPVLAVRVVRYPNGMTPDQRDDATDISTYATMKVPFGFILHDGDMATIEFELLPDTLVEVYRADGKTERAEVSRFAGHGRWTWNGTDGDIIAYRIIEAPASEHPASVETAQQSEVDRWIKFDDDTPEDERKAVSEGFLAQRAGVRRDSSHMREDLRFSWRYGYDIAADPTGIGPELGTPYGSEPEEPSPYAEAVSKGAITQDEADFLVSERERIAADEQARFFAEGMMADADRHAQDQRGIVDRITGMFKREREDA